MQKLFSIFILSWLSIGTLFAESVGTRHVVECGSWMELRAQAAPDYHFVRWNDDNTDSIRQIQVNEDAHYVAFFAANCGEYANWPLEFLYDQLLVINKRYVETTMGYTVEPSKVRWYRVVGDPDALDDLVFPQDDRYLGEGTSFNVGRGTSATYYGILDVSSSNGLLCSGLMRSHLVLVGGGGKKTAYRLSSTYLAARQATSVLGIDPDEDVTIRIHDIYGHLIQEIRTNKHASVEISAPEASGCYFVRIVSSSANETLRFLVR